MIWIEYEETGIRHGSSRHEASQPLFIVKGCLVGGGGGGKIKLKRRAIVSNKETLGSITAQCPYFTVIFLTVCHRS